MRGLRFLVSAASVAMIVGAAHAQTAADDDSRPDDIIVTASKQGEQTLQKAPLAIQAFTGEALASKGVKDNGDLVALIPGAAPLEQVGSLLRAYSLRGSGAGGAVGDPLIGYYLDDAPFAIPNIGFAPPVRFLDLDRIEVLRGPQGTLYGQGSMGGTIIYHTRSPNLTQAEAQIDANASTTREAGGLNYGLAGAISVPIVKDTLALRVSGGYDHRAGYVDVYSGGAVGAPRAKDANYINNSDIRATLLWKPSDTFQAQAQIWHFEGQQGYTQSLNSLDPPTITNYGGVKGFEKTNFEIYSLSMQYDLGFATLSSSTSYLEGSTGYLAAVAPDSPLVNRYPSYNFSQETRLTSNGAGPLHWFIGSIYSKAKGTFNFDLNLGGIPFVIGDTITRTKNWAVFGEASYDLFDGKLVPLVGLRYFDDDRRSVNDQTVLGTRAVNPGGAKARITTWRANLSYYPNQDLTIFFNAGTGFRSGIVQSQFQVDALAKDGIISSQGVRPDRLINYELGIKARLAGDDLQVGLNLYSVRYKNLQSGLNTSTLFIPGFATLGNARSNGIDLEVRWKTPVQGLALGFTGNVNDSKFLDVNPLVAAGAPAIRQDGRMLNTAKFNTRVDVDYSHPIGDRLDLTMNASASTGGNRLMNDGYIVPSSTLFAGSIGLRRGDWKLSLFGENLSDSRRPTFVRNSTLFAGPFPRTIGLRLTASVK
ncbi:TonB-dependent receptor plug domain-containing protein [Sphingobium sp. AN641]|uniref:TonB-dependent receptor n=1 Tax=Sphingobium sp. AN641 TaxID=3133443 RepID=UPI0030C54BF8